MKILVWGLFAMLAIELLIISRGKHNGDDDNHLQPAV